MNRHILTVAILALCCATAHANDSTRAQRQVADNLNCPRGRSAVMDAIEHAENRERVYALNDAWDKDREDKRLAAIKRKEDGFSGKQLLGSGGVGSVVGVLALVGLQMAKAKWGKGNGG